MMQVTPETLPQGMFYYIVTPNGKDPKRQYLYDIKRPKEEFSIPLVKLSPVRQMAKRFNNLTLCRAFCDFLNRAEGEIDFCVVMEG
jgi:hypothetical protein